jgi:hypothetical protein
MTKSTTFIAMAALCLAALTVVLAAAIITSQPADDHMNNIEKTLVGMNLTYYSIAGQPLNYTIGSGDIQSVEKADHNGQAAWKVRVGQGMQWDLIMDQSGKQILDTKQLFAT